MDLAGAVVGEVYRDGRNYFNSRINYAKNLENNHIRLKEVAKNLSAKMKDMENAANRDRTKELSEECKCWIDRVKESEEEVQVLETDYEKIKNQNRNLLSKSFSRNRAKVSKRMEKKLTELLELYSEGTIRLDEKPPERVIRIGAPKIEGKSSLHLAVKEILGHLRTPDIKRVGLWGIMGVGKTAIMQNMNNNADVAKMFDIVIWLTVSKYLGIEKLLRAITQRLKLNVEDITEPDEIAQRIRTKLEHKKYLLLLDEVGKAFDLGDIGISCNQNDSKVVLATRYFHICNDMMTDAEVQVQRLSEKDAYEMFWEKVGQNVSLSGTVEPKSRQVVKECSGLPLLIEKIAPSFRRYGENLDLWEDGLRRLQEQPTTISKSIDEVIGFLEFCYNQLGDEVKKFCFLYGALYPEDCEIYIDHLLECWKAEDFIHDEGFRFARITGWGILNDLILSSLLEMSEKMNHVRMNKVVRRMARKISNVESREANRISLRNDKLCTLPEMPSWRMKLLTLFLHRNLSFEVIPESFFELMKNLQVLDLHRTGITSLPSSISSLTSLKALYLNSCNNLEELPTGIKNLIHLEILDIRDTKINVIPIEIQGLTKLKCLRLSLSDVGMGQSSDAEFGKDVLSKLSLLEELRINVDEKGFPQLGTFMDDISRGVASLEKLTSLSICFPGVDYLEEFISSFHLWRDEHFKFQFSVGSHDQTRHKIFDNSKYQMRRCLKFANGEGVGRAISNVLAESDTFELTGHKGVSKLSDFGVDNYFEKMSGCLIEGCHDFETLIDVTSIKKSALMGLEEMHINDAANLTSIWEGDVDTGSLARLKTLTLCQCPRLKKIFSKSMIEQLSELQNLKVEKCYEIEEIIMKSENSDLKPNALRNLKTLVLLDLPKVISIWDSDSIKWSSLEKIEISKCPLLKKLPFNNKNATDLE